MNKSDAYYPHGPIVTRKIPPPEYKPDYDKLLDGDQEEILKLLSDWGTFKGRAEGYEIGIEYLKEDVKFWREYAYQYQSLSRVTA